MSFKESLTEYMNSDRKKSVEIEFPNGNKEKVYFMPMTVGDWIKINLISQGDTGAMQIFTLIEKAETEDGSKMFTLTDKPFLETVPSWIITKITNEIIEVEKVKDLKKD